MKGWGYYCRQFRDRFRVELGYGVSDKGIWFRVRVRVSDLY